MARLVATPSLCLRHRGVCEKVEHHAAIAWDRLAEIAGRYLGSLKGTRLRDLASLDGPAGAVCLSERCARAPRTFVRVLKDLAGPRHLHN
jgi:hypothetical protein